MATLTPALLSASAIFSPQPLDPAAVELFVDPLHVQARPDPIVEIARRLNLEIRLGKPSLPAYPVPAGETTEGHLRAESRLGLARRWPVTRSR